MGLIPGLGKAKRVFNPVNDIESLEGKVILVTGGNTGLGYETIRQLYHHNPAAIYLCSRTKSKGEEAIDQLRKEKTTDSSSTNQPRLIHLSLDLASLASVEQAAKTFLEAESRLDILINNAGIMATPPGETVDGYEIQFGTNHMGHALLTKMLLPLLRTTAASSSSSTTTTGDATTKTIVPGAARIINLTSEAHNFARNPSTLLDQPSLKTQNAWRRYGYSKLANIIFTRQLAERENQAESGVIALAIHPGIIMTNLYGPTQQHNPLMKLLVPLGASFLTTIETGALNTLWAATASCVKSNDAQWPVPESGAYYTPVGVKAKGSPAARNKDLPLQLWDWTQRELTAKGY